MLSQEEPHTDDSAPSVWGVGEVGGPAAPESGPMATPSLPVLSRSAVWILLLLPLVFFPMFRLTPPHVGLWPALLSLVLAASIFLRRMSEWDRHVAGVGVMSSLAALALFGASLLALQIPGAAPQFSLQVSAAGVSWAVRLCGFAVLVVSVVCHEVAHGLTAFFSGDPTAKQAGRISLNPIRHVDLFGTVILPAIMAILPGGTVFGWAKPVPVNLSNLRSPRKGRLAVSISGVAVNFMLAMLCASLLAVVGIALHSAFPDMESSGFTQPWKEVKLGGIPYEAGWRLLIEILKAGLLVNFTLFTLNILPIPPLDGYGVVEGLAPSGIRRLMERARGWGSVLFLVLVFTDAIDYLLIPGLFAAMLFNYAAGALAKLG